MRRVTRQGWLAMEFTSPHASVAVRTAPNPILLLGLDGRIEAPIASELRALHLPVSIVSEGSLEGGAEDVIDRLAQEGRPPSVVVLPEKSIRADSFEEELAELRIRAGSPRLVPIAVGRRPDEERREALRKAGILLALFAPFGRHALRFQINRALSPFATRSPRGDRRAPTEWRTRTYSGGREKAVRCYSISTGGAYFVTPRPWVVGSDIAMELPVSKSKVLVEGRILYTNVESRFERPFLPGGMAVAFRPLSPRLRDAIRRDVTRTQFGLEV